MIYCHNCEEFHEPIAVLVSTGVTAPDGVGEEYWADACSKCGSLEIEEAGECELCEEPCKPTETFCDDCKSEIKKRLVSLLDEYDDCIRGNIQELIADVAGDEEWL